MFNGSPGRDVTGASFRDKGMNVRVPFQVPSKGVKDADKAGCKIFGFIDFGKHAQDDIADRRKKKTEASAVLEEEDAQFFRNGEDAVPVDTGDELTGHMEGAKLIILVAAGRTETAAATKRNKLEVTAMGTAVHGSPIRRATTMNHLVDIFGDSGTWMKLVNYVFIIISKNGL